RKRAALLYKLGIFRRRTNSRCGVEPRAVKAEQQAELGLANAKRVFQHGIENRLQISRRRADDTQDLRGRCLLLQRLAQLARALLLGLEQAYILDGDHGLVGERTQQFDLLVGEGTHCLATEHDHADGRSFPQQRDAQQRMQLAEPNRLSEGELGVGCDVRDLNSFAVCDNAADDRSTPELDRMTLHELVELSWVVVASNLQIA